MLGPRGPAFRKEHPIIPQKARGRTFEQQAYLAGYVLVSYKMSNLTVGTTVTSGPVYQRTGNAPRSPQSQEFRRETPILRPLVHHLTFCSTRSTIPLAVTSGNNICIRRPVPLPIHVGTLYVTSGRIECDSQSWASTLSSSNHP